MIKFLRNYNIFPPALYFSGRAGGAVLPGPAGTRLFPGANLTIAGTATNYLFHQVNSPLMFIGHFAVAYVLVALFPGIPPLVPLLGVSFPDLLWPVLVFTGIEKVKVDPATPRQVRLVFLSYPYSHALISGSLISVIPGAIIGFFFGLPPGLSSSPHRPPTGCSIPSRTTGSCRSSGSRRIRPPERASGGSARQPL